MVGCGAAVADSRCCQTSASIAWIEARAYKGNGWVRWFVRGSEWQTAHLEARPNQDGWALNLADLGAEAWLIYIG